jgi:hypothetical protein
VKAKGNIAGVVMGTVAGLLIGAGGGFTFATKTYNEQVAKINQSANAKLAAADAQIQKQNEQIQKQNEQAQEMAQPELPLRVSVRNALMGGGKVAQLHNFGATQLAVAVTAHSSASNQENKWRIVIPPNGTQDIGHTQGWTFASGDELAIFETGYRPMKVDIP